MGRGTSVPANRRWDARRDENEPEIVEALEAVGVLVYRELPCDLLVRRHSDPPGILRTLEVKVPKASGEAKLDKRQKEQAKFVADTGTPYVTTAEQALQALGVTRTWPVIEL
jgi:hypothetical protein